MLRDLPSNASSNAYKLICATHFIATLNTRSLPSPGKVTSNSTWRFKYEGSMTIIGYSQVEKSENLCTFYVKFTTKTLFMWSKCRLHKLLFSKHNPSIHACKRGYLISAYWQWIPTVEILSSIKHGLLTTEYLLLICTDHSFYDFSTRWHQQRKFTMHAPKIPPNDIKVWRYALVPDKLQNRFFSQNYTSVSLSTVNKYNTLLNFNQKELSIASLQRV